MCPVGIKECTGKVYNLFSSPYKNQSRIFRNDCYNRCLKIFLFRICHKLIYIFRIDNDCHSFLGFGNRDLCSVQSCIFLWHFIQLYPQSVCQFSDGNWNSSGTKVITLFNQMADFFSAEQTLDLTLCRCISLLHFSSACLDGLLCMNLGRTCCSSASVTTGTTTQQDNDIARIRIFTDHCTSRCCTKHCSDLHTLCDIIRMVDLFYQSGCKTDLVSVRTVSMCSLTHQLFLWKLSFQCLVRWNRRVSRSRHTHRLIYISTSWQRITDCTAKAGSCSTKRLDLCRMVVRLIFKIDQPFFLDTVYLDRYNDTARIDLIGLFLICKLSFFF